MRSAWPLGWWRDAHVVSDAAVLDAQRANAAVLARLRPGQHPAFELLDALGVTRVASDLREAERQRARIEPPRPTLDRTTPCPRSGVGVRGPVIEQATALLAVGAHEVQRLERSGMTTPHAQSSRTASTAAFERARGRRRAARRSVGDAQKSQLATRDARVRQERRSRR